MTTDASPTVERSDAVVDLVERFEAHHDVTVVAARDVGSRAWNLDDPTSDRDVAVLFAQHPYEYATLDDYEETLQLRDADADCHGWNVRRFVELLAESNPSALEFLHSPLRYQVFDPLEALEVDVGQSFTPIALYHHYRSLATRQYRKYLQGRLLEDGELAYLVLDERGDEYLVRPIDEDGDSEPVTVPRGTYEEATTDRTVKRHLYVARGVLYAQYVRDTHRFPLLDFPRFLDREGERDAFDPAFLELTRKLVDRKRRGDGDAEVGRLFDPEDVWLPEIDPADHAGRSVDRDRLDGFIESTLEAVYS